MLKSHPLQTGGSRAGHVEVVKRAGFIPPYLGIAYTKMKHQAWHSLCPFIIIAFVAIRKTVIRKGSENFA